MRHARDAHRRRCQTRHLSLSAGYDFQQGSWTFSPYVRADEVAARIGSFGIGALAVLQRGLTLFTDYDTGFTQKAVSSWRLTFGLRSEL